jgi:hypothetical protein
MELDDLKNAWKTQPDPLNGGAQEKIRNIIRRSNRGLDRMLVWEGGIGAVVAALTLLAYCLFPMEFTAFHVKLIVPIVLYAIPVLYRLFRSSRLLRQMDFSGDLRSTLSAFLNYYTTTLRYYQWGAYGLILLQLALFFTDPTFQKLTLFPKALVTGYMIFVLAMIGPFVRRFYGSKAKAIRAYLEEETGN